MPKEASQLKFIVLDANVFISDYWLRSPSFVLLRHFLETSKVSLVIPKVVFEEVVNHHKEDLEQVKVDLRNVLRDASRLQRDFNDASSTIAFSKKIAGDPYEKFLTAELAGLKAQIFDYNEISHQAVVQRDLQRKRPFQQSGKGYRDTLIWETIMRHCIHKGAVTSFITQNVRDFCESEDKLHKDLRSEIVKRTHQQDSLVLYRDLAAFTDTHIVPYLKTRQDFAILVQNNKVAGLDLHDVSDRNVDVLTKALDKSPSVMIYDPGIYEPEVDIIDIPTEFQVKQASQVSKNVLLVVFSFEAYVAFIFFMDRSEYYTASDEELSRIEVLDHEWNEHVMQVESFRQINFECRLTFNTDKKEVESFEVEGLSRSERD